MKHTHAQEFAKAFGVSNEEADELPIKALKPPGPSDTSPAKIEKVLKEVYAVRGDPSREHTLVFWGTPDEFAFFKARLCEWAKKRILP